MQEKKLPPEFKKYFWDIDFDKLSVSKHINSILSRLLSFGNMQAIRWVVGNIGTPRIKQYVLGFGEKQLDKRSLNFWKIYLNISRRI
ncbi:hypothetical protein A2276_03885 [candidate division WOR-1 bacterium RIFOXYA12_FULL_43_27]|uniref:DUF6922 domain-containing protein n=1 Tax=candidate division WOR-1 bacterium RIFOXYC2_FULL_46_14 TaxID=1802587 RepID=A0A1F4U799_UNCSA|nr:MAG: hypothetical protein A2276_03885 [candidate division WOR-1 bacterium RIFOXYA12_FULL_43_27]OGC19166.1 MAG: hypothetical protein A2292_00450 [candidate division WOR-1 bacterium RIFOXYB2_FULL_46_45]OGC30155.1 MAG: hypothetical protein A2232_00450 [candidate division WOR-1 bacterium RIFOXYA2_FULL_46_56]OGC40757.1 MAG: hypothetical protein A2438_00455 [candidate division WOR-1 bacterium RIFOXYC2_FULL_46_14]